MTEEFKLIADPVNSTAPVTSRFLEKPKYEVLSSGGGTQSTAMAALIVQGKLPKPDIVAIVDTGREMPTTWEYLNQVTRPKMKEIGIEVHRVKAAEYANNWGHPSLNGWGLQGTLLLPAFTDKGGKPGKQPGFCSTAWKPEVLARWLKQKHGISRKDYKAWIGFSLDEDRRWTRMQNGKEWKRGLIRLPLVYDVPTKRQAAIELVKKMGWPTPPRSRCWMCPNQSDREWHEVKAEHPSLFTAAIQMDEDIRKKDSNAYLHSSIKPLKDADLSKKDDLFSSGCPSGECFL
jgi:uncharacterized OB-fold protein